MLINNKKGEHHHSPFFAFLITVTTEQTLGCLISCTYKWPSGKEAVSILPSGDRLPPFDQNITLYWYY